MTKINLELRFEEANEHFISSKRLMERLAEKVEYDQSLSYDDDLQAIRSAATQMIECARQLDWIRGVLETRHFS